ncbi:hypothetical protein P1J78_19520 [Psychromarinibacter sp. C21-152]|uniref:Uncharacterized protein n=1 Tax=Psychromarinibacter sediminicola TaxID=3033385 RepID=A0AAE3NSX0_9RHOB|nr:hypothetical protein [Psychromarinibacter sediminicola]MDF0602938.1 hypothetical protein [Psychromarinibacter sediminicola]
MTRPPDSPGVLARLMRIWRRHPVLGTLFPLALALTLFFTVQGALHAVYWADPAHRDQTIAGWMTPRYVAHSWAVPREVMARAVGEVPRLRGGQPTLERIAEMQGVPLAELIARIEAEIAAFRTGTQ